MAKTEPTGSGAQAPQAARRHGVTSTVAFVVICAIPVFANLAFGGVNSGAFTMVIALNALLAVLWFAQGLQRKELRVSLEPAQLAIIGLVLLGLVQLLPLGSSAIPEGVISMPPATALTVDPNGTRFAVIKLFVFAVYFAAALTFIDSPGRIRKTSVALIIFGSLMSFFAVLQFLADPNVIYGMVPSAQARPFGTYINQHHFASFLVMIFGLTLGVLAGRATKRDKIVFLVIAAVLLGTGVIFTGSRGAFLSLLSVLAFLAIATILLGRRRRGRSSEEEGSRLMKNPLIVGGAAAALLVLLILTAIWAGGEQGLIRGAGMQEAGQDFSTGRLHFWSVALQIFRHNPLIGTGLESFGVAFTKYDSMNGMFRIEQAHNDYLQILADGGIVGFLIAASFIFFLFRGGIRVIRDTRDRYRRSVAVGALAGCFGVLVHSVVDFPLRTNANAFFFLLLASLALRRLTSRRV